MRPRSPMVIMVLALLAAVATYAFVLLGCLEKPFANDEIYYAGWAHGLADHLSPTYYAGEYVNYGGTPHGLVEPISHPLMHFNLLGIMVALLGLHYWSLRLLGVVLLAVLLVYLRRRVFVRHASPNMLLAAAFILLVLNPLFVQEHLVLAIEAQAFWLPVMVFLDVFHRECVADSEARRRFPFTGTVVMVTVLLWFKETNVPIYSLAAGAYLVARGQWRRVPWLVVAVALGAALFWVTWLGYCEVTDVDVFSWWNFTVKNKMAAGAQTFPRVWVEDGAFAAFGLVSAGLKLTMNWASPAYVFLAFAAVGLRARQLLQDKQRVDFVDLCLAFALSTFLFSKLLRPTQSYIKYEVPGHVALSVFIVLVFAEAIAKRSTALAWSVVLGATVGLPCAWLSEDRILQPLDHFWETTLFWSVVAVVAWAVIRGTRLVDGAAGTLAALSFAFVCTNMPLHIQQSRAQYTTGISWGNYGQDLQAPIDWLNAHMRNGDGLAAFKDIQFNMRYVEGMTESPTWETRVFTSDKRDKGAKRRLLRMGKIRFIVTNRYTRGRVGRRTLRKTGFKRIWKSGDHAIYAREE